MKLSLPLKIFLKGFIGLAIFAILLGVANFLTRYITHPFYGFFVNSFNNGFWTIIILVVLFLLADVFRVMKFPYSLPSPLLNSFGYAYLAYLVLDVVPFLNQVLALDPPIELGSLKTKIIVGVFFLTVLFGYFRIFYKRTKENETFDEEEKNKSAPTENKPEKNTLSKTQPSKKKV